MNNKDLQLGVDVFLTPEDDSWEDYYLKNSFDYEYGSLGEPDFWPDWTTVPPEKIPDIVVHKCLGESDWGDRDRILCYKHAFYDLYVANYWDGDGTTVIFSRERKFISTNTDSKCWGNWDYEELDGKN